MTKIINDGYYEGETVLLEEIKCVYVQEPDCTESKDDDVQELELSTRDGGGGKFIHIKTNGWSISDIEDLEVIINNFKSKYESSNNS